MTYRNIKTGAVIDSPCPISGGDWVPEEPAKIVAAEETKETKAKTPRKGR